MVCALFSSGGKCRNFENDVRWRIMYDDILELVFEVMYPFLFILLAITFPIWCIPYLIYKVVKKKRGGRQ